MVETALSDSEAAALSGTTDADLDVTYCTIGEAEYYTTAYRKDAVVLRLLKQLPSQLRVYKDGDLTFGVRAGRFTDGPTPRDYAGATGQSLTDDATNYIYLTSAGALTTSTTGFPSTPHVPLATIVTASGAYDHDDVTDYRGRAALGLAGGVTISAATEDGSDTREITIQGGPWRHLLRVWLAASDYGAPDATGNTVTVDTGTTYETETAHAAYKIISDSAGTIVLSVTVSGAASRYLMVESDGRIVSSGEITWAA